MYYFLHGKNIIEARKKLKSLVETLHSKRPDAEIFRVNDENWSDEQFDELLIAQGLFDQKYIIVLDFLFDKKDIKERILERVKDMKESDNVFLILEGGVDKKTLEEISKYAEKTQEFTKKDVKKEFFNTFALGDALGNKDKKSLWVGYLEALRQDVSAEEICGVLFWQVKNILIAMETKSASESKLSPFVDSKARRYAKNFTKQELRKISNDLVDTTEKVRNGEGEMEVLLERVLLGV